MSDQKSTRPYVRHGLHALESALKTVSTEENWVKDLGEVGQALQAWREAIIQDLGGEENISAMERSIVELATKTHLLLSSIDRFLLQQDSLIHKTKRQLFPVVVQRQQLADSLARYMNQLGLKRRPKPTSSLGDYLAKKQVKEEVRNSE
ncbi:hypothetical protein [Candidatus Nitrospira bockiana]